MEKKLGEIARVVRSKNSGPFTLTLDIIFEEEDCFEKVLPRLTRDLIAEAYRVTPGDVEVIGYPPAYAIKINIPRLTPSGHPGDRDVYGAQQHAPLLDLQLDVDC